MPSKKITKTVNSIFEQIKRIDENGNEYTRTLFKLKK